MIKVYRRVHTFLTMALDMHEWPASQHSHFTSINNRRGGWVGLRPGQYALGRREKTLCPAGN